MTTFSSLQNRKFKLPIFRDVPDTTQQALSRASSTSIFPIQQPMWKAELWKQLNPSSCTWSSLDDWTETSWGLRHCCSHLDYYFFFFGECMKNAMGIWACKNTCINRSFFLITFKNPQKNIVRTRLCPSLHPKNTTRSKQPLNPQLILGWAKLELIQLQGVGRTELGLVFSVKFRCSKGWSNMQESSSWRTSRDLQVKGAEA